MIKFLALSFLLLNIGGTNDYQQSTTQNDESERSKESFDIKLQVDKITKDQYNLDVTIELENGSYVISPYSKDDIYGHFGISIPNNSNLSPDKTLLEIPSSVEEHDPILDQPVKFVRGNTIYKQRLKITNQNDFEVKGLIEFVLEP